MAKDKHEFERLMEEANKAKYILDKIAQQLYELGYTRKGNSCMTLAYKIEEWQNRN